MKIFKFKLVILCALFISGCFTTNTTFTQRPVVEQKIRHTANLTYSSPLILIPQNIGASYHFSTPGIWNDLLYINAFAAFEAHSKTTVEDNRFQLFRDPIQSKYLKTNVFKLMLMPSLRLNEKYRFGIGYGINSYSDAHLIIDNNIIDRKINFNLHVFQLNLSKLRVEDEKRLNYWNTQLFYLHRTWPNDAIVYSGSFNEYFDLSSTVSQMSLMSTYINERKMNHRFISRGVFKISFGVSVGYPVQPNNHKCGEKWVYEFNSFLFPFCFSYGFLF
jgi:hypothetical protein